MMLRMTLPNGWETIAPAFFTSFTSPLRNPIARGNSSTSRVSMHVNTTSRLLGNWSVRNSSYSLRSMNSRLCSKISETMLTTGDSNHPARLGKHACAREGEALPSRVFRQDSARPEPRPPGSALDAIAPKTAPTIKPAMNPNQPDIDPRTLELLWQYMVHADQQELTAAATVQDEPYFRDQGISFGSIHKLLVHAYDAQRVWL